MARAPRQSASPVVSPCRRSAAPRRVQRGRSLGRPVAAGARRSALQNPLSERRHAVGSGTAPAAGIFLRFGLAAGPGAPPHPKLRQRLFASRTGRDPAKRYASEYRNRRADANSRRSSQRAVGPGLENHCRNILLYEPHAAAGGVGELAGTVVRTRSASASRDNLRDQRPSSGIGETARSTRSQSNTRGFADRREQRTARQ